MEHTATPHERDRLNDEIERAYLSTELFITEIQTYRQMERGGTTIDLYQNFYSSLHYLFNITKRIAGMREIKHDPIKESIRNWLNKPKIPDRDRDILERCAEGVTVFHKYADALFDEGILTLPRG